MSAKIELERMDKVTADPNLAELARCLKFTAATLREYKLVNHHQIDAPGVYVIADFNFNILYVGEAKNICTRLKRKNHPIHRKLDIDLDKLNVRCMIIHNDHNRYRAETILIAALAPIFNSVKWLHGKVRKR